MRSLGSPSVASGNRRRMGAATWGDKTLGRTGENIGASGDSATFDDDIRWTTTWAQGYSIDSNMPAQQPGAFSFTNNSAARASNREDRQQRVQERFRSGSNDTNTTRSSYQRRDGHSNHRERKERHKKRDRNRLDDRWNSNRRVARH